MIQLETKDVHLFPELMVPQKDHEGNVGNEVPINNLQKNDETFDLCLSSGD
jgi:hypothetical protein